MFRLITILALCLPAQVLADLYLQVPIGSYHAEPASSYGRDTWNQKNTGIGLHYLRGKRSLAVGTYHNSMDKTSVYALYGMDRRLAGGKHFALSGSVSYGLVTGYNWPVIPAIVPQLALSAYRTRYVLTFIPPIPGQAPAVIGLTIEYKVN